jgi:hypothetical protein
MASLGFRLVKARELWGRKSKMLLKGPGESALQQKHGVRLALDKIQQQLLRGRMTAAAAQGPAGADMARMVAQEEDQPQCLCRFQHGRDLAEGGVLAKDEQAVQEVELEALKIERVRVAPVRVTALSSSCSRKRAWAACLHCLSSSPEKPRGGKGTNGEMLS